MQGGKKQNRDLDFLDQKSRKAQNRHTQERGFEAEDGQDANGIEVADSDVDDLDFNNFKGIYFGDKHEKYTDPKTGCHFEYYDLCRRLAKLKQRRKVLDV
jgi:hypothetical protein